MGASLKLLIIVWTCQQQLSPVKIEDFPKVKM